MQTFWFVQLVCLSRSGWHLKHIPNIYRDTVIKKETTTCYRWQTKQVYIYRERNVYGLKLKSDLLEQGPYGSYGNENNGDLHRCILTILYILHPSIYTFYNHDYFRSMYTCLTVFEILSIHFTSMTIFEQTLTLKFYLEKWYLCINSAEVDRGIGEEGGEKQYLRHCFKDSLSETSL